MSPTSPEPCQRCGLPLPEKANFCPNCGAPVSLAPPAERRVVTVVFVDLASSTELAGRLDPERYRDVLAAFHGMVQDEISWLGGQAETFIGDAVLGVFGVPTSHDDDAVRAIRASLDIVEEAEELGKRLGLPVPMRVRIGVNTGRVAVGGATDRNIVIGVEVNAGARLQQAAEPGQILIGATTHLLAQTAVEFGDVKTVPAKGFEDELVAWPVVRLSSKSIRSTIRMVNRRRELALLHDTFERVKARERAHLVTLLGEPGIGKSRIVTEFRRRLPDGVQVLSGRSSVFEEEVTFWPIAQMVYRLIGEERGAPTEEVLASLREHVDGWVGPDDGDRDRAARRLGIALGLVEEDEEHRYRAAEVRRGVLSMLEGIAKAGEPLVLVFEDLHEADPLLLDLLEQLVKDARKVPLMVICVARWEFLEARPGWAGGIADAVTLWVEPLSHGHAVQLATEAGDLSRADAERVAVHSGGNPFFIVEITGMLMREEGSLPPAGPAPTFRLLPPTVQAVIAARIDALSPAARELVRRASVFPRGYFGLDELAIIVDPATTLLEEAADEELLIPDEDRPSRWRFRSDVLRDVAYESLAKRERQRLHLRVANKLSEPERAERFPRTIAFHLEQAARASLDLNPRDRSVADRAITALETAGDLDRRRMRSRAAADLYQRALSLSGPEEGWGVREAWLLSKLGETEYWLGEFDSAQGSLERALALAEDGSDQVTAHACRYLADITLTIRGDGAQAAALFERSLVASRRLNDPYVLARTLLMAGWVPFWQNQLELAQTMFREALDVALSNPRRDHWAEARAMVGLASVISPMGDEREALAVAREALAIGQEADQEFTMAIARQTVAASLRRLMHLDDALADADAAVTTLRELGARWELAGALGERGSVHRLAGRLDEAETDLREAFALCLDLRERALITWTASELARTLALRGEGQAAREILEHPGARSAETEPGSRTALLVAELTVALAAGDTDAAATHAQAAIAAEAGPRGVPNALAAQRYLAGHLFGAEAAGGAELLAESEERLRRNGWLASIAEVDALAHLA
ncbi:MAG: AAA family ATPase [Actinomycetota bacterium]